MHSLCLLEGAACSGPSFSRNRQYACPDATTRHLLFEQIWGSPSYVHLSLVDFFYAMTMKDCWRYETAVGFDLTHNDDAITIHNQGACTCSSSYGEVVVPLSNDTFSFSFTVEGVAFLFECLLFSW